jgi:hypothetical protein
MNLRVLNQAPQISRQSLKFLLIRLGLGREFQAVLCYNVGRFSRRRVVVLQYKLPGTEFSGIIKWSMLMIVKNEN